MTLMWSLYFDAFYCNTNSIYVVIYELHTVFNPTITDTGPLQEKYVNISPGIALTTSYQQW